MMHEILIVDDDPLALAMLRDHLTGEGYVLHLAKDWAAMNDVLFKRKVAVLILDVNMPGMKGDVLAEIVQRNLGSRAPRIVLHSGLPEAELRRMAVRVGATGWISKQPGRDSVVKAVRAAVARFELESTRPPAPPSPSRPPVAGAPARPGASLPPGPLARTQSEPPGRAQLRARAPLPSTPGFARPEGSGIKPPKVL